MSYSIHFSVATVVVATANLQERVKAKIAPRTTHLLPGSGKFVFLVVSPSNDLSTTDADCNGDFAEAAMLPPPIARVPARNLDDMEAKN